MIPLGRFFLCPFRVSLFLRLTRRSHSLGVSPGSGLPRRRFSRRPFRVSLFLGLTRRSHSLGVSPGLRLSSNSFFLGLRLPRRRCGRRFQSPFFLLGFPRGLKLARLGLGLCLLHGCELPSPCGLFGSFGLGLTGGFQFPFFGSRFRLTRRIQVSSARRGLSFTRRHRRRELRGPSLPC